MNYDEINADGFVYSFDNFIPCEKNPVPYTRIMDFITVGPFVLETDGSFEAEHMYEREKILYEDYLSADGGEANIVPFLGQKVKNNYYGDEYLKWEKGFIKWNTLRFDKDDEAVNPALYATEQRNAVYYAAFYLDCSKDEKAVISHDDSGSMLFINGEVVDFKPFGRVKGLDNLGYQCLVNFKKGRNLVMFKLRPGYIADTMDISISSCIIYPIIAEKDGVCITSPSETYAYSGTKENPRMVFHAFAAAENDCTKTEFECDGLTYTVPPMKKGDSTVLHFGVVSHTDEIRECDISFKNSEKKSKIYFHTVPYDGYEGNEHIMSDFHFDTTYHQEQRTYALGAFHITKSIVDVIEKNPDFKAVLSEVDYLHPYYTLYPAHRKAIKNAFETGRAEADCFYNQPNDLTSSGEGFVRNLVYGQLYHRDVMGRISKVYAPGDVFGHFSQMTQVCFKGGCNLIRWGKPMMGVDRLFRHVSPDGSVLIHDKGIDRADAIRLNVKGCGNSSEALSYVEPFPRTINSDWMKETIHGTRFSVFSDLAEDILRSDRDNSEKGIKSKIDLTSRDITQHHSGVLLTRTDIKQANRICENLLTSAEKFAAVAFLYGAKYPEKALDKAWRQVLCAQHHDSITGTNNEISFIDLMIEYREAAEIASDVLEKSAKYIASLVKTNQSRNAMFVFNPVSAVVEGVCRFNLPEWFEGKYAVITDTKGKEYPVHIDGRKAFFITGKIPATGYSLFRLESKETNPDPVSNGNDRVIENSHFRLTVDAVHGGIISVYDKKEKREIIDSNAPSSANAVYALHEIHDRMETQHELYTDGLKVISDEYNAQITSEKCRDYQKLTVVSKLGTLAKIIREIVLYRNSNKIDFRTVVEDYNSEDELFCTVFPMNIKGGAVIFDDRFAPHVSTRSKKYMSFQTHQYASFSGCRVLPANRWFGIGPSVTVKTGHGSVNMGMTALIRKDTAEISGVSEKLLTALSKKAIPVTPYPDTEQHGGSKIIHFNEDIYETDTRIVLSIIGDGNLYTEKLVAGFKKKTLAKLEKTLSSKGIAVVYTSDSDNAYQKPVDVFLVVAKSAEMLNRFTDDIAEKLLTDYIINLDCIEDVVPATADSYGAEIINSGNISSSVEGNTLNLMLFHTAAFYGNMGKVTGGKELVPEQKTHVFTYALYPHSQSFREADTYGKATEYNEQLFAVQQPDVKKDAFLKESFGFLKAPAGIEITAFKAGGFPYASLKDETRPVEERGFTVRCYESHGVTCSKKLETGFEIKNVLSTDLLEENGNHADHTRKSITVNTGAHSIETFVVSPVVSVHAESEILGTEKDITEPTYVRSWEHDMGSVATGYLKFAATLDKKSVQSDDTHLIINLNAVNNSLDTDAQSDIRIECSEGLTADRQNISVCLKPEKSTVIPFNVTKASADTKGQIKIFYHYDGQLFTDVYEIGYFNPDVNLKIDGNKIICTVTNQTDQQLNGSLLLATPYETWGNVTGNINAYGTISPLSYSVSLEPFGVNKYEFTVDFNSDEYFKAYYAAVKLCCNGRIHFAFADVHGPRHNVWGHEFIHEINAYNGSIKKLLEM